MKRFIVIFIVLILVGGGGAGGLIMMGVIPNPFNPDSQGFFSDADKAAAEMENKFKPPTSAPQLVKMTDMIIPVIVDGRLVRKVYITVRLVVVEAQHRTLVEETLAQYQNILLKELIPYFQTHFNNRDVIDLLAIKRKMVAEAHRTYGDLISDVLLINIFQQDVNR